MSAEGRSLLVHATGPQALVQDAGRPGHAGIGVGRSGAADREAYAVGNRALGNPRGHAAVEVVLGGLEVEVVGGPVWLCVTGAPCPVDVDGREVGSHSPFHAAEGSRVRLGAPPRGLRSYLAVRGGIDVDPVLGSRSTDLLSGLGPDPLEEGVRLPVGASGDDDLPGVDHLPGPVLDSVVTVRAVRGPRADWLVDADLLTSRSWSATDRSNRVGVRLATTDGDRLSHARQDELPSEGVWRGSVQVPPSGEPVVFLADHPVTGGYPVVAVVVEEDLDLLAQVRPGQELRFRWVAAP